MSVASVGASGAEFGLIACIFVDLIQNWKMIPDAKRRMISLVVVMILSFAIGFAPGIDNFSHIGGFFMGLLAGFAVLPTVYFGKYQKKYAH